MIYSGVGNDLHGAESLHVRPSREHPARRFGRAAVIGAGIAGLLTARALAGVFEEITVFERDHLPSDPRPRRGVPQGRHAHALQARGLEIFSELFPGLRQQLHAAGAPVVDFCQDARLQLPGGAARPMPSGILIQPVSRPLLETAVRTRVAALPGVRIRDGCTVTGLLTDSAARQVTGVHLTHRAPGSRVRTPAVHQAELVVDAGGRASHLPDWLVALGLPRVAGTTVDARVGYASRRYRTGRVPAASWRALFEPPQPPGHTRGCFALHIEDHQLLVTLQGAADDHPPTDDDGFHAFARSLHSDLATVLAILEPHSSAVRYARTANRRTYYHRLSPWPDGLLVLGDAACVFNPVYAQGMTVAAVEARALRDLLVRHRGHDLTGFARRFQHRLARITAWPWAMATLTDRGWPTGEPSPATVRAACWYLRRWQERIPHDPRMFEDFVRVANMLAGPATLVRPRHLARALAPAPCLRRDPRRARPETVPANTPTSEET
ncbi:FAD-dependent oxidoreductase [Streptomyces caatingaensis]|uniref:FAD-dependent oxidoreductase n=1 Tax=Streptomyces caatingaensis TaxID=1678637 RepID=UPI0012FEB16B|nr:hypothetical protein [Streptomyces caatingaensis]